MEFRLERVKTVMIDPALKYYFLFFFIFATFIIWSNDTKTSFYKKQKEQEEEGKKLRIIKVSYSKLSKQIKEDDSLLSKKEEQKISKH